MKKYLLVLFFIITVANFSYGQIEPPSECDVCDELFAEEAIDAAGYQACLEANNCNTVPIDSNILVLFSLAISFGAYSVYKNKKKLLKN